MENKIVWRLFPFLNHIYPVRIKAEDDDTVTDADWPHNVISKAPANLDMALVVYATWEDAHNTLCRYRQECVDILQKSPAHDSEKHRQQLEYYLSKLEAAKNLKKPKL